MLLVCDRDPAVHLSLMCLILILFQTDDKNQTQISGQKDW